MTQTNYFGASNERPLVYPINDDTRREFETAITRHRGNLTHARKDLGLSHKTMYRYIVRLRLWEMIDRVRGVDATGVDYERVYQHHQKDISGHRPRHLRDAALRRLAMEPRGSIG